MMAQRVMGDTFFAQINPDSGEGRFWPVAFHDDNSIRLVESRTDHPNQKHLAVEFSVSSLMDMQEARRRFKAVYDEVIALEGWQELEDELLGIEGRLDELLIDNRLENGMLDPAFTRWGEEDESAVSVPLHEARAHSPRRGELGGPHRRGIRALRQDHRISA